MTKKLCVAMTLVFALSAATAQAGGRIDPRVVDKLAFNSGGLFLYASGWSNPNSCTRSDAIVLLDTDINYDKAYSLILTAFASGKTVEGYSDGCASFDGQAYNTIRGYKYLLIE